MTNPDSDSRMAVTVHATDAPTCPSCSTPIVRRPGARGRLPRYCAPSCKPLPPCPTCSGTRPPGKRYCSAACTPSAHKPAATVVGKCGHCGGHAVRPAGNRGPAPSYCNLKCKSSAANERAKAEGRTKEWSRRRAQRKGPAEKHSLTCVQCELVFKSRTRSARFCSKKCQRREEYERRIASGQFPEPDRRWINGRCRRCSEWFTVRASSANATRSRHCSERCRLGHKSELRRALLRDAYVADINRIAIFERDGWVCQLCFRPTERAAQVPHLLAPTIDHIIPLAVGGPHEPANAQCAHYSCNSAKGARCAKNGQLAFSRS